MRKITLLMVGFILSTVYASAQWPVNTFNSIFTETKDIEKDAAGNIYVLATFQYKTTFNSGLTIVAGGTMPSTGFYVAKYDLAGNLIWAANSTTSSSIKMEAVDMEVRNGEVFVLSELDPSLGTPPVSYTSSTGASVATGYIPTAENYYVSVIDLAGNPMLIEQVDMAGTGVTNVVFNTIQPHNVAGSLEVFLGGSGQFGGPYDAYIGEFLPGVPYTTSGNQTVFTAGASAAVNTINDLELVYSSAVGYDVLFSFGTMGAPNPIGTGLPPFSVISDCFITSFDPFGLGLNTPLASGVGAADYYADGIAMDAIDNGSVMNTFATGDFKDDLTAFALPSGGVTNAFMVSFDYDPVGLTFTPFWGYSADYTLSALNEAHGKDVDISDAGNEIHFGGDFDGDGFNTLPVYSPSGTQPASIGFSNGWQAGFDIGSAPMYSTSVENINFASAFTLVGVCEEAGEVYSTGDYLDDMLFNPSTAAGYTPMIHPAPGALENYVARYGGGAYFKTTERADVAIADGASQLNIYPNPANEKVQVTLNSSVDGTWNIKVYNMLGAMVYASSDLANDQDYITLDLDEMPSGVYLVRVEQDDFVSTQQLVVE